MPRAEEIWLTLSAAVLVIFMLIVGYQTIALGMGPPSHKETIDPQRVDETPPFDEPGVRQIRDDEYEVVMTLQSFAFNPHDIEVPSGATVHFTMTSKDVVHGLQVAGTNINAMVVPGYIQKISHTFDEPGNYLIVCNEYCGIGHQNMSATITVK